MGKEIVLVVIPIAVVLIFMVFYSPSSTNVRSTLSFIETTGLPANNAHHANSNEKLPSKIEMTSDDCSCPEGYSERPCSVSGDAVMGGLDFVQYFTDFKNEDGSYDETQVGSVGDSSISSTYAGFKYYFLSETNKALFDTSPESYIPQWGGFCSYGVAEEGCPTYAWSADCLGPSGNYGHWSIQNEKLYFFLFAQAKAKFMAIVDTAIADGDARWESWYGSATYEYMSTSCFVSTVNDDV